MITYYRHSTKTHRYQPTRSPRQPYLAVVESATSEDVAQIAKQVKLTSADLYDLFDAQEIPRLDTENKVLLLFIRAPLPLEDLTPLETQLYMAAHTPTRLFLATNSKATHTHDLLSRPHESAKNSTLLAEFLLHLSKRYSHNINEISRKVEQTRSRFNGLDNHHIEQLINYEIILNEYVSVLSPMQQLCHSLVQNKLMGWTETDHDLLEELTTNMSQAHTVCLVNLKKISTLRDSFQIIFTNRLNQNIKFLTSATIILTIPTMIASLFGMNFRLPLGDSLLGFWLVTLTALSFASIAIIYFRRQHWF